MTEEFLKISVVIIIALGISVLIKNYRPEYSVLLTVAVSLVVVTLILKKVYPSVKILQDVYSRSAGNSGNFGVLLKAMVISYISCFCSDTCRDFGQTALAQKVEFAGRCAIFVLTLPMLISILETAVGFVEV